MQENKRPLPKVGAGVYYVLSPYYRPQIKFGSISSIINNNLYVFFGTLEMIDISYIFKDFQEAKKYVLTIIKAQIETRMSEYVKTSLDKLRIEDLQDPKDASPQPQYPLLSYQI